MNCPEHTKNELTGKRKYKGKYFGYCDKCENEYEITSKKPTARKKATRGKDEKQGAEKAD